MSEASVQPVPPVALSILAEAGRLDGSNGRYEKFLPDLDGLYRDAAAYQARLADDDGQPVYWVETTETEPGPGRADHRHQRAGARHGGAEYAMTRGHLHAIADRSELYVGLSGRGVMILDTVEGETKVVELNPGQAVYVPGHWVHRSVNVGTERLATLFCYAADAGQDYSIIERAGGMKSLVVVDGDGWAVQPNPDHRGYQPVAPS